MLSHFYTLSLIFMSGMTAYSVLLSFNNKNLREQRLDHWLFTAMSVLAVAFLWVLALMLNSASVPDYLLMNRIGILLYLVFLGLLLLFFTEYSGIKPPKTLLAAIYGVLALLFFIFGTQPQTSLFREIHGMEQVVMPWGERLFRVRGVNAVWPALAFLVHVAITGFGIYALQLKYRRSRKRRILLISFSSLLFLVLGALGLMHRLGIGDLPPLGPVGFVALLVAMGVSVNHDIRDEMETQRRRVEESGEELGAIYQNAPLLMMIMDAAGIVQKINTTSNLSTLPAGEAVGRRIGDIVRCVHAVGGCSTTPACAGCVIDHCLHHTIASGVDHQQVEVRLYVTKDGRQCEAPFLLYTKKLSLRNQSSTLVCLLDVSEQQRLREQLLKVEQQERTRLSRDLHDGVGQTLQAIRLQLKLIERRQASAAPAGAELATLIGELDAAAEELREIAHALHPTYLDSVGLQQTLKERCERLSQRGVPIVCQLGADPLFLSHRVSENLFRIAQEALANAVRHANAARIQITLGRSGDLVTMSIADDGCGIGAQEPAGAGTGLDNIRERAALIGAALRIVSDAGGTCITVEVSAS